MLNLALKQIEKDYGEGAIMKLGENVYNIRYIERFTESIKEIQL